MNRVLSSLKENFSTIGKILLLVVFCGISGFAISYPLWKFAKAAPQLYTGLALGIIGVFVLISLAKHFSKLSPRQLIKTAINFILIAGGITGFIILVLNEYRLYAVILAIAAFTASFFANTFLYEKKQD